MMTWLPGHMRAGSAEAAERAHELAAIAVAIAAAPLQSGHSFPPWRSWAPPEPSPPVWGDTALWRDAIDRFRSQDAPFAEKNVLLHRDLHPLNVLWVGNDVSGVVDWVNACVGHPHAELGHCRWNLTVLAGKDTAGDFLSTYLAQTGTGPYDSWWDLAAVMGLLPDPPGVSGWHAAGRTDLTQPAVITRTEEFLRAALDH